MSAPDRPQAIYVGVRSEVPGLDRAVYVAEPGRPWRPLRHVGTHTIPAGEDSGYAWGYGGSGPASLALAIVADALGERPTPRRLSHGDCACWHLHQAFKWDRIASLPIDSGFFLHRSDVLAWIASYDGGERAAPLAFPQARR